MSLYQELEFERKRVDTLVAAIHYAIHHDDRLQGIMWLEDWVYGEPSAMDELESHLNAKT